MGVRRASLEARGKSAPFTRVPLPRARAGSWQAHHLLLSGWLWLGWLTVAMCPLSVGEACRRHAGASGTHPWVACSPRYAVDLDTGGPFAARRLGSEAVETSQQVTPGLCITNALRGHASPVRGLEISSGWADLVLAFACCSWVSGRTGCGRAVQG